MATLPNKAVGLGAKSALIIVDATLGFTDPGSPLGCPSDIEVGAIKRLLGAFRRRRLPIVFTTNAYSHPAEASVFREKLPLLNELVVGGVLAAIDPRLQPQVGEVVLNKGVPSAFFDSPLRQMLCNMGVDSVVVCGFSTSGCVRATAVDALQSNFRLMVVADACGDRDRAAHAANLRDLGLKYGDVVDLDTALEMIERLPC
ncbi:MAG TPA: isochorismatase family protein [Rhodocyclaceae bacterium]|nr:isochorismatase family protein [Rhodocyclaceae bacterium]